MAYGPNEDGDSEQVGRGADYPIFVLVAIGTMVALTVLAFIFPAVERMLIPLGRAHRAFHELSDAPLNFLLACLLSFPLLMGALKLGKQPQALLAFSCVAAIWVAFYASDRSGFTLLLNAATIVCLAMLADRWQPWWVVMGGMATLTLFILDRALAPDLAELADAALLPLLLALFVIAWLQRTNRW